MGMTPEDVLSALAAHAAAVEYRKPDPLVEAERESKVGNRTPSNWRTVRYTEGEDKGKINVEASWPSLRTALGRGNRQSSKSSLHEAAADALVGMHKRNWQTLQTAIGIDSAARAAVTARLMKAAWQSQKHDNFWPEKLERRQCFCRRHASPHYARDLVELAVLQLEHPMRFNTHHARAEWFGLSDSHWYATASKPFDLLSGRVWGWYNAGIGYIEQRLSRRRREKA